MTAAVPERMKIPRRFGRLEPNLDPFVQKDCWPPLDARATSFVQHDSRPALELSTAPLNQRTVERVMAMKAVSTDRRDFIWYPTNRVVGTIGDAGKAKAAIDALLRAGFDREDIDMLHGEEDLQRLDPTGAEHGFLAQFQRTLIRPLSSKSSST